MISFGVLALVLAATPPSLVETAAPQAAAPHDVALVVGIEDYAFAPDVPFAERDAQAFVSYLLKDRGVPADRVRILLNGNAARESIEEGLKFLADQADSRGTVWFFFAGHGLPATDGSDGMLAGVDVQQTVASGSARSLKRGVVAKALAGMRAGQKVALLDACFSGQTREGTALIPNLRPLVPVSETSGGEPVLILSAGSQDELSGPYEAARQGLFTYFAVGGLKGWADLDGDGSVAARELAVYVRRGANTILADGTRKQNPTVNADSGDARLEWVLARSITHRGPNLVELSPALGGRHSAPMIRLDAMPALTGNLKAGGAIDLGVDAEALVLYDTALRADEQGKSDPENAARAWARLASYEPGNPYRTEAGERAKLWREFADRKNAYELQRSTDRKRLERVLPLAALALERKRALIGEYAGVYGGNEASALVSSLPSPELRTQLCSDAVWELAERSVTVKTPVVDGDPLKGAVSVDGRAIGSAPGTFKIPACAQTLTVTTEEGLFTVAIPAGTQDTELHATFAGVVDDANQQPLQPAKLLTFAVDGILAPNSSGASLGPRFRMAYRLGALPVNFGFMYYLPLSGFGATIDFDIGSIGTHRYEWTPAILQIGYLYALSRTTGTATAGMPALESRVRVKLGNFVARAGLGVTGVWWWSAPSTVLDKSFYPSPYLSLGGEL